MSGQRPIEEHGPPRQALFPFSITVAATTAATAAAAAAAAAPAAAPTAAVRICSLVIKIT
jgi:hypothetical protein